MKQARPFPNLATGVGSMQAVEERREVGAQGGYKRFERPGGRGLLLISAIVIVLFWGLFCPVILAADNQTVEADIGYIQLNVKDINVSSFFEVMIDGDEKVYLPLSKVFELMELRLFEINWQGGFITGTIPTDNNSYYYFDFKTGKMQRDKEEFQLEKNLYFTKNNEVYLYYEVLQRWMPVAMNWDYLDYQIRIYPEFKLVSEILEEQKAMREKYLAQKQVTQIKLLKSPARLWAPGVFNYRSSIAVGLKGVRWPELNLRYAGQVLGGDLEMGARITRRGAASLTDLRLIYHDWPGLSKAIIGSNVLSFPFLLRSVGQIQGITFSNQDERCKFGVTTLSGTVPPGSEVELYNRGMLIGFQTAEKGLFNFPNIHPQGVLNEYEIVVYTKDGRITREKRYVLSRDQQLSPGKYIYDGGIGIGQEGVLFAGQGYYGVNDKLTLGGMVSKIGKDERTGHSQNFLGGEVSYKPNPWTFFFLDAEKGVGNTGFGYTCQWQSVWLGLNLRSGLTGYLGAPVPNREALVFGSEKINLDGESFVEIEQNGQRQGLTANYGIKKFANHYLHQFTADYSYRLNFSTGLHVRNVLWVQPGTELRNLLQANLSYSGLKLFDLKADAAVAVGKSGITDTTVNVDLVNKRDSEKPWTYYVSAGFTAGKVKLAGNVQYKFSDVAVLTASVSNDSLNLALSLQETRKISWPFKKVSNKATNTGWVQGRVYLDLNGNGQWDTQEMVFSGVKILVDDRPAASTGPDGKFLVEGLVPYQTTSIRVDTMTLDALYLPVDDRVYVLVRPTGGMTLDFPVMACSGISGNLVGNAQLLKELSGKVEVVLKNSRGDEVAKATTEVDGFFLLDKVLPGNYTLTLKFPEGAANCGFEPADYPIQMAYSEMPLWIDGVEIKVK